MLTCKKDLFSLPPNLHYLNCAYMAPLARSVELAGIEGLRGKRDPTTIGPADFFDESHRVRRLFAELIHADASDIALIPSASYGLASIARNLKVRRGGRIILLEDQFPSNVYIWRRIAQDAGATVVTIGPGPGERGRAERWNERILEAIDGSTDVVALPHVHWTDGTRFDLETISDRTRDVGAALVVDGTQSVGALSFDVRRIRPDALICAGYKWLLGPYALGVAYLDERHHGGSPLEENWIGRLGSEQFSRLVNYEDRYQPGAVRFDVGERSNFILVPMLAAALELVLEWGPDDLQTYCKHLCSPLVKRARALGYAIEPTQGRAHHLFGMRRLDGIDPERLRQELARNNVSVSVRGTAIRVAPHVYNDDRDVDALIDAMETAGRS